MALTPWWIFEPFLLPQRRDANGRWRHTPVPGHTLCHRDPSAQKSSSSLRPGRIQARAGSVPRRALTSGCSRGNGCRSPPPAPSLGPSRVRGPREPGLERGHIAKHRGQAPGPAESRCSPALRPPALALGRGPLLPSLFRVWSSRRPSFPPTGTSTAGARPSWLFTQDRRPRWGLEPRGMCRSFPFIGEIRQPLPSASPPQSAP